MIDDNEFVELARNQASADVFATFTTERGSIDAWFLRTDDNNVVAFARFVVSFNAIPALLAHVFAASRAATIRRWLVEAPARVYEVHARPPRVEVVSAEHQRDLRGVVCAMLAMAAR